VGVVVNDASKTINQIQSGMNDGKKKKETERFSKTKIR